jgi:hypothetical protein
MSTVFYTNGNLIHHAHIHTLYSSKDLVQKGLESKKQMLISLTVLLLRTAAAYASTRDKILE